MAAIDIGPGAANLGSTAPSGYTRVDLTNPSNDTGIITAFEIFAGSSMSGVKIGTFSGSGTDYTCRDYESIGNVTSGSKQTFSGLNCNVTIGDFIGQYETGGGISYSTTGGSGIYYKSGDGFLTHYTDYASAASYQLALYGTGATVVGWTGQINGVTNPAKIWGIAVDNIAKVGGI